MVGPFAYSVFGLSVRSDVPFGDYFPEPQPGLGPDVEIRLGDIDLPARSARGYAETEGGTLLTVPGVARFLIRDGRQILIALDPGGSERNVRTFLLGSAFGALLHQRGLMPLHANALDIGGQAVAFSGHSGAGKSTLAAWFHDRGLNVLADDVSVIGWNGERPVVQPGVPRLRLWREALEASGREASAYERSFADTDKYDVPIEASASRRPLPLAAVYFLTRGSEGELRVEEIAGAGAVEALVENTYRGAYLKTIGRTGEHLMQCVRIAQEVPVFRVERAWDLARLDEEALKLRDHAAAVARKCAGTIAAG